MAKYKLIDFISEGEFKFRPTETDAPGMQARPDGYLKEDMTEDQFNEKLYDLVAKYTKDPDGEMQRYMSAGFQGFSDSVSANLSKDMDFITLVQIMHDQDTFRKERGLEEAPIKTDIGTVDTDFFPQQLSKVDTNTAKVAVRGGKKDKDEKDDAAIASKIKTGFSTPVSKLFPAQTEVIPEKAVGIALGMLNSGKVGGNLGAIVSGDNHIMDGHHRWAATTLVDPNASVEGIKIDIPGDALVGILNVYTKGALGRTQGNPGKGNVNAFTPEKIKSVLDDLIEKGTKIGSVGDDGSYSEKQVDGEEVKKILGKMKGANGDPEKGKELMAANAAKLNKKIPSWAPPRVDMPVINSDELGGLISKLKSGEFDIVEPYSLQVRVGRKDKEEEEPVAEGLDFIHMMKVRAGIIK